MRGLAICIGLALLAGTAMGNDQSPPAWRGSANSSTMEWEFYSDGDSGTGLYSGTPDGTSVTQNLPFGNPFLWITSGTYTSPKGPDGGGAWDDASMTITLQNLLLDDSQRPGTQKDIRLQITYSGAAPSPAFQAYYGEIWTHESSTYDLGGGWSVLVQDWHGVPAADYEEVSFSAGSVSEIVIDTRSIPEPASLAMLALGGLALLRRRAAR